MKFKTNKPVHNINPLSQKRTYNKYLVTALGIFITCIVIAQIIITIEYLNTHTFHFQSPILFQAPLMVKRIPVLIQSPQVSTKSGQIKHTKPLSVKELLKEKVVRVFGADQWLAMDYVVTAESNYNLMAINASSGACGIMQALPCSKLLTKCPNMNDADCQTDQLINYVSDRYQTPQNAMVQEIKNNWY